MSVLKEPRKKGRFNQPPGNPFPVLVESDTGIPAHLAIWRACSGRFNGDCVEVCDSEDISLLYNSVNWLRFVVLLALWRMGIEISSTNNK